MSPSATTRATVATRSPRGLPARPEKGPQCQGAGTPVCPGVTAPWGREQGARCHRHPKPGGCPRGGQHIPPIPSHCTLPGGPRPMAPAGDPAWLRPARLPPRRGQPGPRCPRPGPGPRSPPVAPQPPGADTPRDTPCGGDISHEPLRRAPGGVDISHEPPRPGECIPSSPRRRYIPWCPAPPPFPGWAGSGGAGPGGDGGRRRGTGRAAAAAGGSGGAGPGPGLAGGPGAAVPGVPGPLRAAELLGGGATALPRPPAALHGPDRLDLPRRLQVRVHVADGAPLRPGRPQGAPVPWKVALLPVPVLPGAGLCLRLLPQRPGQLHHAAALQSRRPPGLPHVPNLRRLRLGLLKRLVLVHRFPHEGHGCDRETGLFLRFGRRPALRVPVLRQDAGAAAASLNQHLQGLPPSLPRLPHLLLDPRPLRLRLQHGCERGDRAPQPGVVAAVVPAEPPAPAPRLEVRGRGAAAAGAGAAGAPRLPPPLLGAGRPRALAHRHHPPQRPLLQFPGGRQPLPPEGQLRPLQSGLELPGGERGPSPPPGVLPCPVPSEPPAPPGHGLLPSVAF